MTVYHGTFDGNDPVLTNPARIIETVPDAMRWASAKLKKERAEKEKVLAHIQAVMFWRFKRHISREEAEQLFLKHAKNAEESLYQQRRKQFYIVSNPSYMTGLMVNGDWADMLVSGYKTVETRSYPIPAEYVGVPLMLIKTGGSGVAQAIGVVQFSGSKQYPTKTAWGKDRKRHRVPAVHKDYGWNPKKKKFGWVVEKAEPLLIPIPAPDGDLM